MFGLAVVLLICGNFVHGQIVLPERCPESVVPLQNFDASKYVGKWYEVEKYPTVFEIGGKCVTAVYTANDNGTITVNNTQINSLPLLGSSTSILGIATFNGPETEAKLSVVFTSTPVRIAAPYWVLDTDYDNYAVVWSCVDVGFISTRFVWILTRAQDPPEEILATAFAVLDRFNISRAPLTKTIHQDCNV